MSEDAKRPVAILAAEAPPRPFRANYPEPFASRMAGRDKRPLGDLFGLTNFGVNITHLAPGGCSALRHAHTKQDEFVYVLEGCPTLVTDAGRTALKAGMCAGFKAGSGDGHALSANRRGRRLPRNRRPRAMGWTTRRRPRRGDGRWEATDGAQGRRAILIGEGVAFRIWLVGAH